MYCFFCKGDNHASVEFFKSLQQIAKEVRIHELCICPPNLNFSPIYYNLFTSLLTT